MALIRAAISLQVEQAHRRLWGPITLSDIEQQRLQAARHRQKLSAGRVEYGKTGTHERRFD
jgi:hypothetical protein